MPCGCTVSIIQCARIPVDLVVIPAGSIVQVGNLNGPNVESSIKPVFCALLCVCFWVMVSIVPASLAKTTVW